MSGFLNSLQQAIWNGVPFHVVRETTSFGRKLAMHDYPFRDGVWPEDMGRRARIFGFEGYLLGDDAPALAELLKAACEFQDGGILIHPSLGAVQASVLTASIGMRVDALRVIDVHLEFIEQSPPSFVSVLIATVLQTLTFATLAQTAASSDFSADTAVAVSFGPEIPAEAQTVLAAFGDQVSTAAADPTAAIRAVATLPGNFGRYAAGAAGTPAPATETVDTLRAAVVTERVNLAAAFTAANTGFSSLSVTTDTQALLAPIMAALVATANDPADQVRLLLGLVGFTYADANGGVGLSEYLAIVRDATSAAIRRAAIVAIAQASSSYQPTSYQDAANVREEIVDAIDAEITIAGDAADNQTYSALLDLKGAVSQDLTTRGAALPQVVTVSVPLPMPALELAYSFYGDTSRSDEMIRRANPVHPAFMPTIFEALAS